MTFVHVIAGFLGSGKTTTLLDQIARRPTERLAVLVNDFGVAAIDHAVVGDAGRVALTEIDGACVCCTAPDGLTDAVGHLLDTVRPDRLFVEPTGIARPADVVDTLQRGPHRDRIVLAPLVVIVDPHALTGPHGPSLRAAAECADVLVANRVDLATDDERTAFRTWASGLWPGPLQVIETTHGRLPDSVWAWPARTQAHHHDHAAHPFGARSWTWPAHVRFSRARVEEAFDGLRHAARAKGLFQTPEGAWLFEVAGGRVHARVTGYRRDSRVDLVLDDPTDGAFSDAHRSLEAAVATDAELRVDPSRVEIVRPDGTRVALDRAALAALPDGVPDVSALVPGRTGVAARLRAAWERMGIADDLEAVVIAADGFASPPVRTGDLAAGLLVHSLGDAALPDSLGGPFRLLIPGDAGPAGACSNVKGVVRIALRARA